MTRRSAAGRRDLEEKIGHAFTDASLLDGALTHLSALSGKTGSEAISVSNFSATTCSGSSCPICLFRGFPAADEGELSRRLADLVRRETCAEVARSIDLGAAIRLGTSEANAGGRSRAAILADVCEALIGAVFLDGGYQAAVAVVEHLWGDRLRASASPVRDAKTALQEWAQGRGLPTPSYREIARTGPDHDPQFRVAVLLPELMPAEGIGRSKRAAEQAAAAALLSREGVEAP